MENLTLEELRNEIKEYEAQLAVVEASLIANSNQPEFIEVRKQLQEVLAMTKDLLMMKKDVSEPSAKVPAKYPDIQEIASKMGIYLNQRCEAQWDEDKEWYKCNITNISPEGFTVKFEKYKHVQTVGPDQIRHLKLQNLVLVDHAKKGGQVTTKDVLVVDKTTGDLVLPPSLKILPTDSEQARRAKKKGIRALKNDHRKLQQDDTRNKRKAEWQNFVTKSKGGSQATKKLKTGGSIFQSPETVDGKVGVTGSGKAMTSFSTQKYEPKKLQSSLPVATKKPVGES